jgi:hypothetical protein
MKITEDVCKYAAEQGIAKDTGAQEEYGRKVEGVCRKESGNLPENVTHEL